MSDAPKPELDEAKPGEVSLVDRAGERVFVPQADVAAALADPVRAFRPETPEEAHARRVEAKYGDQEAQAAAEGAARGISLGTSDWALAHSGLIPREDLEGRKEASPIAAGVGEAGGVAAGLVAGPGALLAKGAGLAGKAAAAAVGEGLVGRAAGAGIRLGLEGATYGIGNTLDESVLGDTELNAQKIVAGAGMGAFLNIAAGGLGAGLGRGLGKIADKAAGPLEGLPTTIQDYADERAAKAIGATKSSFRGMDMDKIRQHGANLRDLGVIDPSSPGAADMAERVGARLRENGSKIGDILSAASDANPLEQPIPKANELAAVAPGLGIRAKPLPPKEGGFDMRAFVEDARAKILPGMADDPALAASARKAKRLLDGYEKLGNVTYERANELKSNLQSTINFASPRAEQNVADELQRIFLDHVDNGIGTHLGDATYDEFKQLKSQYGSLKWAEKVLDQQAAPGSVGNRTFGLTDHLGAMLGAAVGGPVGAGVGLVANKIARERVPSLLAVGLDRLAKAPWFSHAAEAFTDFAQKQLSASADAFGKYTPVLSQALARGSEDALLTHAVLSEKDPGYREIMADNGLDYTEPPDFVAAKAQSLALLKAHLEKHDAAMDEAMRKALAGGAQPAFAAFRSSLLGDAGGGPLKSFQDRLGALNALANNPQLLSDRVAAVLGPLQHTAPALAQAVAATVARGVAFLQAQAPGPQDPYQDIPALRRPWEPSDADRAKFERYVAAVSDPASVFEGLSHGQVTAEAVRALQAVYPAQFDEFKKTALNSLATHREPLSFQQKVTLSTFMGASLDPNVRPERIAQAQAVFQRAPQPGPHSSTPMKPPPTASAIQQAEMRGDGKG